MKNEKLFMILAYPIIIIVALVAFVFLATPIVLYSFPQIHKLFIASNFHITPETDIDWHLANRRQFYISIGSSTVSVWHFVPGENQSSKDPQFYLEALQKYKIVLYFHSPKSRRDVDKFADFCRMLLQEKIQILFFDYKGFANSAGDTTISGAVEDTRTVYEWLRRRAPEMEIHFWAHGLGGSIATAALKPLLEDGQEIQSLVLENPIPNTITLLKDKFFVVRMYDSILPSSFFNTSLNIVDLNFNTGRTLATANVPTLVLNGEANGEATSNARKIVKVVRKHRDFVFHIEWRCSKVKEWPGAQASKSELKQIITTPQAQGIFTYFANSTAANKETPAMLAVISGYVDESLTLEEASDKIRSDAPALWAAASPLYAFLEQKVADLKDPNARTFIEQGLQRVKAAMVDELIDGKQAEPMKILSISVTSFSSLPEAAKKELMETFAFVGEILKEGGMKPNENGI